MVAIAKTDRASDATRTLIGHSLDVAYAARAMLQQGACRDRLSAAARMPLTDVHIDRLAVLVGLHDFGKATRGFQDRIHGRSRGSGHVAEALAVVEPDRGAMAISALNPRQPFGGAADNLLSPPLARWRSYEHATIGGADEIRLFAVQHRLPVKVARRRNDAAVALERRPEHRLFGDADHQVVTRRTHLKRRGSSGARKPETTFTSAVASRPAGAGD